MKNIIILFILFYFVYCTMDSCSEEKEYENCTSHDIELNNYSCYQIKYFDGTTDTKRCIPFPDEKKTQVLYWNLFKGTVKEFYSATKETDYFGADTLNTLNKDSYKKGEELFMLPINGTESPEDMERYTNKNTCFYKFYGKFYENETIPYQNITDKNICYNVDQFNELKNLLNCGYGEIKYVVNGTTYAVKSCFFVPGKNMTDDLRKIYKKFFVDKLFEKGIIPSNIETSTDDEIKYDIIVEDKNGQKVEYSSDLDDIKVLVNAMAENSKNQTENDDFDDNDDIQPIRLKGDYYKFGIILNILFVLLIL